MSEIEKRKAHLLTSIKRIRELSGKANLVLLVGAGVSVNSGMPTWTELIDSLAHDIGQKKDPGLYNIYDFKRIAGMYYHQRGEVEYVEKIRSLFPSVAKPNPLHFKLLEFRPVHIITTNYDSLIEHSIENAETQFYTVKSDKDISDAQGQSLLIKMHGDLTEGNFVLKEADYDSYNREFEAILGELRSIFARNLVVLVGFSGNDPNFHHIYQDVRKMLGNRLKGVYALNTYDSYDEQHHSYMKELGIEIMYYDVIHKEIERYIQRLGEEEHGLQGEGRKLYNFLRFIQDYAEESNVDAIDYMHRVLSPFSTVPSLTPEIVVNALDNQRYVYSSYRNRLRVEDEQLTPQLQELKKIATIRALSEDQMKKLHLIRDVLGNAWIIGVVVGGSNKHYYRIRVSPPSKEWLSKLDEVNHFRHLSIDGYIQNDLSHENASNDLRKRLESAYLMVVVGEHKRAFESFKTIAEDAKTQGNSWIRFVAIYNSRAIMSILWRNLFYYQGASTDEIYQMRTQVADGSIKAMIKEVPGNSLGELMHDIESGLLFLKAVDDLEDIVADAEKLVEDTNSGGYTSYNPPLRERASYHLGKLWRFAYENCLAVNANSVFHRAIRAYVKILLIEIKLNDFDIDDDFFDSTRTADEIFEYEVAQFMITGFHGDQLDRLFHDINISLLDVSEGVLIEMVSAFDSLVCFGRSIDWRNRLYFFNAYLSNWLELFSHCKLPADLANRLLGLIADYLGHKGIGKDVLPSLQNFVSRLVQTGAVLEKEHVDRCIQSFGQCMLQVGSDLLGLSRSAHILAKMAALFASNGNGVATTSDKLVQEVLEGWQNFESPKALEVVLHVLVPLYPILSQEGQKAAQNYMAKILAVQPPSSTVDIMHVVIRNGYLPKEGIVPNYINALLAFANTIHGAESHQQRHLKEVAKVVDDFTVLLSHEIIKPDDFADQIEDLSKTSVMLQLVNNPKTFDFSLLDLDWLIRLNHNFNIYLLTLPQARQAITQEIQKRIMGRRGLDASTSYAVNLLSGS